MTRSCFLIAPGFGEVAREWPEDGGPGGGPVDGAGTGPGGGASDGNAEAFAPPPHRTIARFEWRSVDRVPWQTTFLTAVPLLTDNSSAASPSANPGANPGRLPVASVLYRMLTGSQPVSDVIGADPIHLLPDRDTATLIPPQALNLDQAESAELLQSLNEFLADDGVSLQAVDPCHWFLQGLNGTAVAHPPTEFMAWRPIGDLLPINRDGADLRRLGSELQMLLHQHPVNQSREARGERAINGLWFWSDVDGVPDETAGTPSTSGTSSTSSAALSTSTRLFTDDPLAMALADTLGMQSEPVSRRTLSSPGGGTNSEDDVTHIVVDLSMHRARLTGDRLAVEGARDTFVDDVLTPLLESFDAGELHRLEWVLDDGRSATVSGKDDRADGSGRDSSGTVSAWLTRSLRWLRGAGGLQR